ncbi:hypothetical protein LINPERPRIM_LOCUS4584 [Linum perenne]
MAKFSFLHFFTLALAFSGMVFVTEVEGEICSKLLYPTKCDHSRCQKKCQKIYPHGIGFCDFTIVEGESACVCHWRC